MLKMPKITGTPQDGVKQALPLIMPRHTWKMILSLKSGKKVGLCLGKICVQRTKGSRHRITVIQACQDELLDDGREGVSKRDNRTKNLFGLDFCESGYALWIRRMVLGVVGPQKFHRELITHNWQSRRERSNQVLFYFIFLSQILRVSDV